MTTANANGDDAATSDFNPLEGFTREDLWCKGAKVTRRTSARMRSQGMPFMLFGGWVYIHNEGSREFMLARVKRLNQPRGRRHGAAKS